MSLTRFRSLAHIVRAPALALALLSASGPTRADFTTDIAEPQRLLQAQQFRAAKTALDRVAPLHPHEAGIALYYATTYLGLSRESKDEADAAYNAQQAHRFLQKTRRLDRENAQAAGLRQIEPLVKARLDELGVAAPLDELPDAAENPAAAPAIPTALAAPAAQSVLPPLPQIEGAPGLEVIVRLMREKKFVRARNGLFKTAEATPDADNSPLFNFLLGYSFLGSASEEVEVTRTGEEVTSDLKYAREFLLKAQGQKPNDALKKYIDGTLAALDVKVRQPITPPTVAPRPAPAPNLPKAPAPIAKTPISAPVAPQAMPKLAPLKPRPGYVIGRAIFADGRPVPKFKVTVLGYDKQTNLFPGSTPSLGEGEGSNGFYAVRTMDTFRHQKPVAGLVTAVQARAEISYRGQTYSLYLSPVDGVPDGGGAGQFKGNSGLGVVRDFVVKIAGVKPQHRIYNQDDTHGPNEPTTFYGAQLQIDLSMNAQGGYTGNVLGGAPDNSQIMVTLQPQGALLDGSTGQTIVRTIAFKPRSSHYQYFLRNIPIGQYAVSAQLITPGGQTVPLRGSIDSITFAPTTSVLFPPSDSRALGGTDDVTFCPVY